MSSIIENYESNCKTLISEQKQSNSITFEIPDYLRTSIEPTSVVSIDSKDYLSLKCELKREDLSVIDDSIVDYSPC